MVGGMEETSDSAITGQSILATIGERLPAMVIPGGKSFLFLFFFPSPSPISLLPFSFVICHLSFPISPFSFVISHLSFVISHFVAQISANVNIYRINSSFLHIICAFLA